MISSLLYLKIMAYEHLYYGGSMEAFVFFSVLLHFKNWLPAGYIDILVFSEYTNFSSG